MCASRGTIHRPPESCDNMWQELVALQEPAVVLKELLDALLGAILNTDPKWQASCGRTSSSGWAFKIP